MSLDQITEALIAVTFREDCVRANKKITENAVTEHVHSHPDYLHAVSERTRTTAISALTYSWWAAVQTRAEMLRLIGFRQNTEIKHGN